MDRLKLYAAVDRGFKEIELWLEVWFGGWSVNGTGEETACCEMGEFVEVLDQG
ncbi:hypothetical protein [Poriferisphaera corsica]|uniref:hypothetical protein n=1 Tax=Poriferisphaera corsica TaxID=2528020 RepID=UPI00190B40E7|nr:hypothetical protein [Poriferisphaera corsica]